jgi:hypothetical protein
VGEVVQQTVQQVLRSSRSVGQHEVKQEDGM